MIMPKLFPVEQEFERSKIDNVGEVLQKEYEKWNLHKKIKPSGRVAIAVGSRGLSNLSEVVSGTVECLKDSGAIPFIIPAMGSHGGATSEGQRRILEKLGITEAAMGVPVVSNMEAVSLGKLKSGAEIFFAKDALEADHVVVINRVKAHTAFRSDIESGLCKMLAIGCGKRKGASSIHRFNLGQTIVPAARIILKKVPVLFGVVQVENALHQIHILKIVNPSEFINVDKELLREANRLLPKIPLQDLDILIVDEMGKDISGAGMDPNVIGFWRREGGERKPDFRTLIILDLTEESEGNAIGIGMADLTTENLVRKVDWKATYTNAITSGVWRSARLPISLENDKKALETALGSISDLQNVRMVRIRNTLSLKKIWVTQSLIEELSSEKGISIGKSPCEFAFGKDGRLLPFPD